MASVPMGYPEETAAVLEDAVAAGASGVEIGTTANGKRIDVAEFEPFWSAVERLDVPVFMHPAYEHHLPEYEPYELGLAIGLPVESTTALERLIVGGTLDRHPKTTVVAALGGGCFPYLAGRLRFYSTFTPGLSEAPPDPWAYVGQIKFDSHLHDPVALRFLIEKAGAENVLIGTDCSFLSGTPEPMTELREAVGDDDATYDKVSFGNAETLFWKN
jgi:aminocarboxymuconate-semialdehyde decarboxylase